MQQFNNGPPLYTGPSPNGALYTAFPFLEVSGGASLPAMEGIIIVFCSVPCLVNIELHPRGQWYPLRTTSRPISDKELPAVTCNGHFKMQFYWGAITRGNFLRANEVKNLVVRTQRFNVLSPLWTMHNRHWDAHRNPKKLSHINRSSGRKKNWRGKRRTPSNTSSLEDRRWDAHRKLRKLSHKYRSPGRKRTWRWIAGFHRITPTLKSEIWKTC